jgi:hypothetical protein
LAPLPSQEKPDVAGILTLNLYYSLQLVPALLGDLVYQSGKMGRGVLSTAAV